MFLYILFFMDRRDFLFWSTALWVSAFFESCDDPEENEIVNQFCDKFPQKNISYHENIVKSFEYIFLYTNNQEHCKWVNDDGILEDEIVENGQNGGWRHNINNGYQFFIDQNGNLVVPKSWKMLEKKDYINLNLDTIPRYIDGKLNQEWFDDVRSGFKKDYPNLYVDKEIDKPSAYSSLEKENNIDSMQSEFNTEIDWKLLIEHIKDAFVGIDIPDETKNLIIYGLVWVESSFDNNRESYLGATWVFQIMPSKWQDIVRNQKVPEGITLETIPAVLLYIAKEFWKDYKNISEFMDKKWFFDEYDIDDNDKDVIYNQFFLASWHGGLTLIRKFVAWLIENKDENNEFLKSRKINKLSMFYVFAQKYSESVDANLWSLTRDYVAKIFAMSNLIKWIVENKELPNSYDYYWSKSIWELKWDGDGDGDVNFSFTWLTVWAISWFVWKKIYDVMKNNKENDERSGDVREWLVSRRDFIFSILSGAVAWTVLDNIVSASKWSGDYSLYMDPDSYTKLYIDYNWKKITLYRRVLKNDAGDVNWMWLKVQIWEELSKDIIYTDDDSFFNMINGKIHIFFPDLIISKKDINTILTDMKIKAVKTTIPNHITLNWTTSAVINVEGNRVNIFRKRTPKNWISFIVWWKESWIISFDTADDLKTKLLSLLWKNIKGFSFDGLDFDKDLYEPMNLSVLEVWAEKIDMPDVFSVDKFPYISDDFVDDTWRKQWKRMWDIQEDLHAQDGSDVMIYKNDSKVDIGKDNWWLKNISNSWDSYYIRQNMVKEKYRYMSKFAKKNFDELLDKTNEYLKNDFWLWSWYSVKFPIHSLLRPKSYNNSIPWASSRSSHMWWLACDFTTKRDIPPILYKDWQKVSFDTEKQKSQFYNIVMSAFYKAIFGMKLEWKIIPNIEWYRPHMHIMLYTWE